MVAYIVQKKGKGFVRLFLSIRSFLASLLLHLFSINLHFFFVRESFKFDILANLMNEIPEFDVGTVFRIHDMVVEVGLFRANPTIHVSVISPEINGIFSRILTVASKNQINFLFISDL